tara:strand:+ start:210 stop:353 length:144 start_codon:yes stop_codon:yes gene_type:complete
MSYLNSELNHLFIDQNGRNNKEKKPDLLLKMGLFELVFHATILILLA